MKNNLFGCFTSVKNLKTFQKHLTSKMEIASTIELENQFHCDLDSSAFKDLLIFVDFHLPGTLTSNVLLNLYRSAQRTLSQESVYLNLSCVSENERIEALRLNLSEKFENIHIFFEVHTVIDQRENQFNPGFFSELRKSFNINVIPICFDLYRSFDLEYIAYWSDITTKLIHIDPIGSSKIPSTVSKLFWPFIFPSKEIQREIVSSGLKEILDSKVITYSKDISFSGSLNSPLRIKYLRLLKLASIRLSFSLSISNTSTSSKSHQSIETIDYLVRLKSCMGIINFSEKAKAAHPLITFRALETMSLGGCLLEQVTPAGDSQLSGIAVPYKHYLPFQTVGELIMLCFTLSSNPSISLQIKENASALWERFYSESTMWSYLLIKLRETPYS